MDRAFVKAKYQENARVHLADHWMNGIAFVAFDCEDLGLRPRGIGRYISANHRRVRHSIKLANNGIVNRCRELGRQQSRLNRSCATGTTHAAFHIMIFVRVRTATFFVRLCIIGSRRRHVHAGHISHHGRLIRIHRRHGHRHTQRSLTDDQRQA